MKYGTLSALISVSAMFFYMGCSREDEPSNSKSYTSSDLDAAALALQQATGTTTTTTTATTTGTSTSTATGKPDPAKVQACYDDMKDDPAFKCVSDLVNSMNNTGTPTKDQMAACGCKFGGTGNGTDVGKRPTFVCPGTPPFYVSPVPGQGTAGIGVVDPTKYPDCFFDLTDRPTGPAPVLNPAPGNQCFNSGCHDRDDPFIQGGTFLPPPEDIGTFLGTSTSTGTGTTTGTSSGTGTTTGTGTGTTTGTSTGP